MTDLLYIFQNKTLLQTALTHSSYANENGGESNERLEFLGDSILGFLAAEYLYENNPRKPEGDLTRMRAGHVCEQTLAAAARKMGVGQELRLGRGELSAGGGDRDSLLADAFEAILGAMYLDGGMEPCRKHVREKLMSTPMTIFTTDTKTRLQELVQAEGRPTPEYRTAGESGPAHQRVFTADVCVAGECLGRGEGKSKKLAEQDAARAAIKALEERPVKAART